MRRRDKHSEDWLHRRQSPSRRRFLALGAVGVGATVAVPTIPFVLGQSEAHIPAAGPSLPPMRVADHASLVQVNAPTGDAARDTAELQRHLDRSTPSAPVALVLSAGRYRIEEELAFPFAPGTSVVGQGRGITTIEQTNLRSAVFSYRKDLTHSVSVRDLTVMYTKPTADPRAIAFLYHVLGGTDSGFFHHTYHNLGVVNAAFGFKVEDNDGKQTVWDTVWDTITFSNIGLGLFSLSPQQAVGMPALSMRNIGSYNQPATSDAVAFRFLGCEVRMDGVDLEGWVNEGISSSGGGFCVVRNLHVEHHLFDRAFASLTSVAANTLMSVSGFSIQGVASKRVTDSLILFTAADGSRLDLAEGSVNVAVSTSAAYLKETTWASPGQRQSITVRNLYRTGGDVRLPGEGPRAGDIGSYVVEMGSLPSGDVGVATPLVQLAPSALLPRASAVRRGQMCLVNGGGAPDRLFICLRASGGGFAWHQVAIG